MAHWVASQVILNLPLSEYYFVVDVRPLKEFEAGHMGTAWLLKEYGEGEGELEQGGEAAETHSSGVVGGEESKDEQLVFAEGIEGTRDALKTLESTLKYISGNNGPDDRRTLVLYGNGDQDPVLQVFAKAMGCAAGKQASHLPDTPRETLVWPTEVLTAMNHMPRHLGRLCRVLFLKDSFASFNSLYPFVCNVEAISLPTLPSLVSPALYVGGEASSKDLATYAPYPKGLGVNVVVNARGGDPAPSSYPAGVTVLTLDWVDSNSYSIVADLDAAIKFIDGALSDGSSVLVHCHQGKSRSVALVAAYLCAVKGFTLPKALKLIQGARPFAQPNPGFMQQLTEWAAERKQKEASPPEAPDA